ncbi:Ribosomal protein S3AE [plant metagenome]
MDYARAPLPRGHGPTSMSTSFPIREECPPGACQCGRDVLLGDPQGDTRILMLTKAEEKKLVARLENIESLEDLQRMQSRMAAQLGMVVTITPGAGEVRTVRGFNIEIEDRPGLCSKTRQTVPAAIRRGLDRRPEIAWALLDSQDLLGGLF